jgi:hypothetical protein
VPISVARSSIGSFTRSKPCAWQSGNQWEITAKLLLNPGLLVSIVGDDWINPSAPYAGDMVNYRYMGYPAWYDYSGGDLVIVLSLWHANTTPLKLPHPLS